jgi:hypothetical protein
VLSIRSTTAKGEGSKKKVADMCKAAPEISVNNQLSLFFGA